MRHTIISFTIGICALLALFESHSPAQAMVVAQLDLTGGAVNAAGRLDHKLDQLLRQDGTILMGLYQPLPDIVPSIEKGHKTLTLFTSGLNGAPAPSATINGPSITVDLSSLFLGVSRGDYLRAWNIGGLATGIFNPETLEFFVSWERLLTHPKRDQPATFFLQGKVVESPVEPIPLPTGLALYVTGLFGLGAWLRFSGREIRDEG
jgi:hypothetical protein